MKTKITDLTKPPPKSNYTVNTEPSEYLGQHMINEDKKEKEIERLKMLIEKMWWFKIENKFYPHHTFEVNNSLWQQFKEENKL